MIGNILEGTMKTDYLLALDQGTTSSRAIVFDATLRPLATAQREFAQFYPQSGWVEHDPAAIADTQFEVIGSVLHQAGIVPEQLAAIGIANQRETTVVWERSTGRPIANAIVWQCRRTADYCRALQADSEAAQYIRQSTGLVIDAYFSASKLRWLLDHVPGAARRAADGELCFGTIDSWLIWHLSGGKRHVTDYTNASRTMLFNIATLEWDRRLLELFAIPPSLLPEVVPSAGIAANADHPVLNRRPIPIAGIAGDQQAALFGQNCLLEGELKNTYGTGCFLLMNTGGRKVDSRYGLLATLTAQTLPGAPVYALEGSVFCGGAVIQWLRDEMGLIKSSAEVRELAPLVLDTGGVYLVPAFTGLGAPHWDMFARGTVVGMTRGSNRLHLIRAAVEAIAWQSLEVIDAMREDSGLTIPVLRVDGGAAADDFLMQFQADVAACRIERPNCRESTALGAAALAGIGVGKFEAEHLRQMTGIDRAFDPGMEAERRETLYRGWHKAVKCASDWGG